MHITEWNDTNSISPHGLTDWWETPTVLQVNVVFNHTLWSYRKKSQLWRKYCFARPLIFKMRHLHDHLWQLFPHSVICAGSDIFQNQLDLKSFSASGGIPWLWFRDDMSGSLTQWRYILSHFQVRGDIFYLNVHSDQRVGIVKLGQWLAHIVCCSADELCICIFFFPCHTCKVIISWNDICFFPY